jgi:hypothetical protein
MGANGQVIREGSRKCPAKAGVVREKFQGSEEPNLKAGSQGQEAFFSATLPGSA